LSRSKHSFSYIAQTQALTFPLTRSKHSLVQAQANTFPLSRHQNSLSRCPDPNTHFPILSGPQHSLSNRPISALTVQSQEFNVGLLRPKHSPPHIVQDQALNSHIVQVQALLFLYCPDPSTHFPTVQIHSSTHFPIVHGPEITFLLSRPKHTLPDTVHDWALIFFSYRPGPSTHFFHYVHWQSIHLFTVQTPRNLLTQQIGLLSYPCTHPCQCKGALHSTFQLFRNHNLIWPWYFAFWRNSRIIIFCGERKSTLPSLAHRHTRHIFWHWKSGKFYAFYRIYVRE